MRTRDKEDLPDRKQVEITIPTDPVNEQVIIAAAVVDEATRKDLVKRLQPDHFLSPEHRVIWSALQELTRKQLAYDPATLQRLVGDQKGSIKYLGQLEQLRPELPENLQWHIDSLLWDKQRATAVAGPISSLIEALRDPHAPAERVRALARHVGESFKGGHGAGQYLHETKELVRTQILEIEKRVAGHACFPYGVEGLDIDLDTGRRRVLPGAAPGQITVLTAISGGGKSTTAAHFALGLGRQRRRVLYGAWEMGGGMTLELLACIALGWSRADLMEGVQLPENWKTTLEEKMHAIGKWVVFMKNPFRRNRGDKNINERNLDMVQEHISDSGCEVFIGDLWKRCLKDASPEAEEEGLMRQQAMAEEMHVHCILLQQQRLKDIEQRADKRPTREGIKGSSAWVEVADTIIGTNLPALWKKVEDDRLEMILLKQRYGRWPLAVEFDWNGAYGSIERGRSIEYDRPGDEAMNEGVFPSPQGKKRRSN